MTDAAYTTFGKKNVSCFSAQLLGKLISLNKKYLDQQLALQYGAKRLVKMCRDSRRSFDGH